MRDSDSARSGPEWTAKEQARGGSFTLNVKRLSQEFARRRFRRASGRHRLRPWLQSPRPPVAIGCFLRCRRPPLRWHFGNSPGGRWAPAIRATQSLGLERPRSNGKTPSGNEPTSSTSQPRRNCAVRRADFPTDSDSRRREWDCPIKRPNYGTHCGVLTCGRTCAAEPINAKQQPPLELRYRPTIAHSHLGGWTALRLHECE